MRLLQKWEDQPQHKWCCIHPLHPVPWKRLSFPSGSFWACLTWVGFLRVGFVETGKWLGCSIQQSGKSIDEFNAKAFLEWTLAVLGCKVASTESQTYCDCIDPFQRSAVTLLAWSWETRYFSSNRTLKVISEYGLRMQYSVVMHLICCSLPYTACGTCLLVPSTAQSAKTLYSRGWDHVWMQLVTYMEIFRRLSWLWL